MEDVRKSGTGRTRRMRKLSQDTRLTPTRAITNQLKTTIINMDQITQHLNLEQHLTFAVKESTQAIFAEAFRKVALADYDLSRIPGIEVIRDKALDTLNKDGGLRDDLKRFEAMLEDHSLKEGDAGYRPKADVRNEIKNIERTIRVHEEFCLQCEEEVTTIKRATQQSKQVASNLLDRCRFIQEYAFNIATLPAPKASEAVKEIADIHDPKTADQPTNPEAAREVAQAAANFKPEESEATLPEEVTPTPAA